MKLIQFRARQFEFEKRRVSSIFLVSIVKVMLQCQSSSKTSTFCSMCILRQVIARSYSILCLLLFSKYTCDLAFVLHKKESRTERDISLLYSARVHGQSFSHPCTSVTRNVVEAAVLPVVEATTLLQIL